MFTWRYTERQGNPLHLLLNHVMMHLPAALAISHQPVSSFSPPPWHK